MLQTENLRKKFGTKAVLKGISIEIENGKITSIVGKNGAGKSTLIALIADYKRADGGQTQKNSLSVMPDADNLFRDMTGLYFLKFSAAIKKASITDAQIMQLAEKLFMAKDLKKKIKSYSFGMKKKISFLQAYIGDFDTYIFDEPTSGVDVEAAQAMLDLLVDLKKQNKAVLLTSHNIEEIERYSDYVYILDQGLMTKQGTVEQLTERKGELENYEIELLNNETAQIQELIEKWQLENYQFKDNILLVKSRSKAQIKALIQEFFAADITVEGFWLEKRALREVVFESGSKEEGIS